MNWKLTTHKCSVNKSNIEVKEILISMAENSWATYSEAFIEQFKERLAELPVANSFPAYLMHEATQRNLKSVEIWKLKANGDFNYKMFTLDYIGD